MHEHPLGNSHRIEQITSVRLANTNMTIQLKNINISIQLKNFMNILSYPFNTSTYIYLYKIGLVSFFGGAKFLYFDLFLS